ncbi:MAG: M23 family metallopeptidase [Betaproteobacteria bacterium]|nr:M23 family metallopeptidase [Betaproteobacteria bacterium]
MFSGRLSRCVALCAVLASVGCIAKRETSELFLRGSIAESSEVVQLDPVFLSRQRQVETRFFGFDDQSTAEKPQGSDVNDSAVAESEAEDVDVTIVAGGVGAPSDSITNRLFPVDLSWPLDGHVTSPFGMRRGRLHAGVDIKGFRGDPIIAAADGQVLLAKRKRAYGVVAIVGHDHDTQTLYAHMLRLAVREGQFVKAGDLLGYVGRSGRATGYHLHFETRVAGGVPQDPMRFLPSTRATRVGLSPDSAFFR